MCALFRLLCQVQGWLNSFGAVWPLALVSLSAQAPGQSFMILETSRNTGAELWEQNVSDQWGKLRHGELDLPGLAASYLSFPISLDSRAEFDVPEKPQECITVEDALEIEHHT